MRLVTCLVLTSLAVDPEAAHAQRLRPVTIATSLASQRTHIWRPDAQGPDGGSADFAMSCTTAWRLGGALIGAGVGLALGVLVWHDAGMLVPIMIPVSAMVGGVFGLMYGATQGGRVCDEPELGSVLPAAPGGGPGPRSPQRAAACSARRAAASVGSVIR